MGPFKVVDEESDGEEEEEQSGMTSNGCCSFLKPRRSMSGRLSASGAPFSRLSTEEDPPAKLQRSRSVCGSIFFCCQEEDRTTTTTTVEVRAGDNRKWQVDVNEEELYVKPPYWKQVVRKVRSQYRRPCAQVSAKSMNYDVHSYQMNFDDGLQHCSSFLYADGKDDAASRARAMHQALCKKMAAGRAM